ncbi:hypothetical protein J7F03_19805 [Streptomyces sp. ISL-43]|uniref:hypothetical protein n=1 Tax=Streptomyces sp. ISL-43 TaxID=2819183 RepID=UPI001BEA0EA6|nr:hypothetical protein [Streptomyces sp. ISL-43]MBT2449295.1 hypothetical protein [Streptomyces sp. ISL-43]
MKLKHMALVAAAAVAGPTILTATPALAQDNPAVVVPDTAPKDDIAEGAADPSPAAGAKSTQQTGSQQTGARQTGKASRTSQAPQGPELSLRNLPAEGFKAGADWSEFSLRVDNSEGADRAGFDLGLLIESSGRLTDRHVEVEVGSAGQWRRASTLPGLNAPNFDLAPGLTLAKGSVHDVRVRLRAAADAPSGDITLILTGTDHLSVDSEDMSYASKIVGADDNGGDEAQHPAPTLSVGEVSTDGFIAGADWEHFSAYVKNDGEAVDDYALDMVLTTLDTTALEQGDLQVEVGGITPSGAWGWTPVTSDGSGEVWTHELATLDLKKNDQVRVQIRMRFAKDAPGTGLSLRFSGAAGGVHSQDVDHRTKLSHGENAAYLAPKLRQQGLPDSLTAGGAPAQSTVTVDNSKGEALDDFMLALSFKDAGKPAGQANKLKPGQVKLETRGSDGTWHEEDLWSGQDGVPYRDFLIDLDGHEVVTLTYRVSVTADAPAGPVAVELSGVSDETGSQPGVVAEANSTTLRILAPTSPDNGNGDGGGDGEPGGTGNDPRPDGGADPAAAASATGGRLAATGADPATTWALGGAGVALAMGAALVAGTGRRRRPTA